MSVSSEQGMIQETTQFEAAVLEELRKRIREDLFETWFHGFRCSRMADHEIEFVVPNGFVQDWVTRNYLSLIQDSVRAAGRTNHQVRIHAGPGGPRSRSERPGMPRRIHAAISTTVEGIRQIETRSEPCAEPGRRPLTGPGSVLNPSYVFETFVVGPSNRVAHAAALAISSNPGHAYNPFFTHGRVGLGKTHLLQAVCHAILHRNPNTNLVYLSCEEFTNRFIQSIQNESVDDFRTFVRGADVLVIDDVDFLAHKNRTQEEFFHTFNALYNSHRQIVLSSDRPASEIPTLEERLVSRFKWGFEADIQPPCFETRVAIIKRKAAARSVEIGDDIASYIAERIDTNIRELEGAITKVIGIATITDREVSLPLAQQALRGLGTTRTSHVSLQDVMSLITAEFSISAKDVTSKSRTQAISLPRQVGMYLTRTLTDHSLEEIGHFFNRDHTTVLYAVSKIKNRLSRDHMFHELLERLQQRLLFSNA